MLRRCGEGVGGTQGVLLFAALTAVLCSAICYRPALVGCYNAYVMLDLCTGWLHARESGASFFVRSSGVMKCGGLALMWRRVAAYACFRAAAGSKQQIQGDDVGRVLV